MFLPPPVLPYVAVFLAVSASGAHAFRTWRDGLDPISGVYCAPDHPRVERKILMRQDLSMPGWEAVMIQTTMQPGGTEGWHTHPGTLVEYVMQGPWTMELRGKPTATYQTGETFSIVEGEVHQAINPGKTAVRGLAILIVDKSKPMTTQVQ
jgi:quercetin dioxygenase-like cupin family protein